MQQQREPIPTMLMGRYRVLGSGRALRSKCGRAVDTKVPKQTQVFFKIPDEADKVETEANELRRALSETQTIPGIRPVRLVDADPENSVLVTEYVPGTKSLFNHLWDETRAFSIRRARGTTLPEITGLLGSWLGAYRAGSGVLAPDVESDPTEVLVRGGVGRMRSISKLTSRRGLDSETISRLTDELRGMGNDLRASGMIQATRIHGDLNLSNVLVASDGSVFVIDFADTRFGLPLEDLADVWHTIWAMSLLSRRRRVALEPCLRKLVEGFSSDGASIVNTLEFQFLRRIRAIVQVLIGVSTASRFGRFGMQANRRLADVSRRWLESGCPNDLR